MKRSAELIVFWSICAFVGIGVNVLLEHAHQHWGKMAVALFLVKYSLLALAVMLGCYAIASAFIKLRLCYLERKHRRLRIAAEKALPIGGYRSPAVETADLDDPRLKRIRAIPQEELPMTLRSYIETSERRAATTETDDVLKHLFS
jgi:hypothetical protein